VTDAAHADASLIPVALAVFGTGMAVGNWVGGRLADAHAYRGLVVGYTAVLGVLVLIAAAGERLVVLLPSLFAVGATMMMAIPTIQVLLTRYAPEAPPSWGRSTWRRSTWPTPSVPWAAHCSSGRAGARCRRRTPAWR
jgi:DHA1 family inner membrane transport protein